MLGYEWDFSALGPYWPAFGRGVLVTVELALLSSVAGTLAGIPLGVLLRGPTALVVPLRVVVDALRATPNLVLIFFVYYFPAGAMFGVEGFSPFVAATLALTVSQAAYTADLVRAAVGAVPEEQVLGLRALGLQRIDVIRYGVVPSVVRQVLPGHAALWIGNFKLSSLASVIGVQDVVFVAKVAMSQSFRSLEAWIVVGAVYVAVVLPLTYALHVVESSRWLNRA